MVENLLTVDEVSHLLRCHPDTVRAKCKRGEIPAYRPGGRWLIRAEDLEDYIVLSKPDPGVLTPSVVLDSVNGSAHSWIPHAKEN